ncbi:DNA cytosine methyltransferase [Gammaproteobacteria bacterium]|nr:DNA cytosine methyltransferase [Gammaproteobacteria bacterium]
MPSFAEDDWQQKKLSKPSNTISVATLFSGIGAVEHALKRLKLKSKIVFAGDIDRHVKDAYFANHDLDPQDWHDDVTDFSAKKYKGKVDLLVGGSPCQSFSMAGKRAGLDDTRGTLFYDFVRVIKESNPKIFVFENVRGLLNHDKGNTWAVMKIVFDGLTNYSWSFKILNSVNYGVPQSRNRLFVVGIRKRILGVRNANKPFLFPQPIELNKSMQDFLEDHIDSSYYMGEKGVKFVTKIKNQQKHYTQINGEIALCQKANQQTNWHGDFIFEEVENKLNFDEFIFGVKQVEKKYYLSETVKKYVLSSGTKNYKAAPGTDPEIARTLLQSMHKMHRSGVDNYVSHKGRLRRLTPRECLRLMGFRDSFKIAISDTQTYRQAGNSIVVDVLIALLKQIDISQYGRKL